MANIIGTNRNNRLFGTSFNDGIQGLDGNDLLSGQAGNDRLLGGNGNDTLIGGAGADQMIGGAGNDRMIWNNGDGSDRMSGGDGFDTVRVKGAANQSNLFTLTGNGRNAFFRRTNLKAFTLTVDSSELFDVRGGNGSDRLIVGSLLGTGVQSIRFAGGSGEDTLDATNGNTSILGYGEAGDDSLIGGSAIDTLHGGDGDDVISGRKGNDTMIGGAGDDVLDWFNGDGSDRMSGGDDFDTILVDGAPAAGDNFTLARDSNNFAIFQRTNLGLFTLTVDTAENFEVNGLAGDDRLEVGDLTATGVFSVNFTGGNGNDTILASTTGVLIVADGGVGNDTLTGGNANDSLTGGIGDDVLTGGGGIDTLTGGVGADTFVYSTIAQGGDVITDFSVVDDKILAIAAGFPGLTPGSIAPLDPSQFRIGSSAVAASDRFLYNSQNGQLLYDSDGTGSATSALIATLTPGLNLTSTNILVSA